MRASSSKILPFQREQHGAPVSNWPVPAERRSKVRYPLDLSVRFRSFPKGSLVFDVGRTVDVSSGGVLVVSQRVVSPEEIGVGALVEMSIEWPPLLDGRIAMQLFAIGRVVRRRPFDFAASFERYEFRTVKSSSQPSVRLGADVLEWPPSKLTLL
jgi:PilZ domain